MRGAVSERHSHKTVVSISAWIFVLRAGYPSAHPRAGELAGSPCQHTKHITRLDAATRGCRVPLYRCGDKVMTQMSGVYEVRPLAVRSRTCGLARCVSRVRSSGGTTCRFSTSIGGTLFGCYLAPKKGLSSWPFGHHCRTKSATARWSSSRCDMPTGSCRVAWRSLPCDRNTLSTGST